MTKMIKQVALVLSLAVLLIGCNSPKPVKTIENLKKSIQGETNANAKYMAFAQKAKEDGFENISKLFTAAAKAEAIHIKNHQAVLEQLGDKFEATAEAPEVKSTEENLQAAISGETYEFTQMYPEFIDAATAEKCDRAVTSFTWAKDAETKHAQSYSEALEILKTAGNDSVVSVQWYICPKCGNIYKSIQELKSCEICGTASDTFVVIS